MFAAFLTACSSQADLGVADIPPEFDHPFAGRTIVESIPPVDVARRCSNTWDVPWWETPAACEWTFPDGLSPGKLAAHFVFPRWKAVGTDELVRLIRIETANANGWDALKKLESHQ